MTVHIGKRGLVLLMFGGVFIAYGLAIKDVPQKFSLPMYAPIPLTWQGWAWVACGVIACLAALTSSKEWWGYTTLFPLPALWTVGYVHAWAIGKVPLNGALVWALIMGILIVLSDWPEPPPAAEGP